MNITVELSLYPLGGDDAIRTIVAFIKDISADPRVEVVVNQLSTQLRGPLPDVMDVLSAAMHRSFEKRPEQVLVAKFLNVDLPIGEAPDLAAFD
ncbi:MAG TPA: YkoF family thiamine/hydroxymethylpyrimidine-binding protein [Gammaproteobacteria bacterium]|nr:YkoF family thiamine/hydroxymethylpyrimidine-binding protein [Gammaproteobacteria bacterium]